MDACAVSVLRYSVGILEWSDKALHDLNMNTRKFLAMFGVFHIRSIVVMLYQKRIDECERLLELRRHRWRSCDWK